MRLKSFLDNCLNRVDPSPIPVLLEGMKQDLLGMFPPLLLHNPDDQRYVNREIDWARNNLKRRDRVVWYMKRIRARIAFSRAQGSEGPTGPTKQQYGDVLKKLIQKDSGTSFTDVSVNGVAKPEWKSRVGHLLSLNLPKIEQIIWIDQPDSEIRIRMEQIEHEWASTRGQHIDMSQDKQAEKILILPDGFAWFNLHRAVCSQEAAAMGHCGNSQYARGTILSLRQQDRRKPELWYPVATFILGDDGYIGEMKGRGNKKPIADYHKYIIPLLQHDMIEGIRGGGYAPEENFSIDDLPEPIRQQLLDQKPELHGPPTLQEQYRKTKQFDLLDFSDIPNEMQPYQDKLIGPNRQTVVIEKIGDREDLLKKMAEYIHPVAKLISLRDNLDDLPKHGEFHKTVDDDDLIEFYRRLSEPAKVWLKKQLNLADQRLVSNEALAVAHEIRASSNLRVIDLLNRAMRIAFKASALPSTAQIEHRLSQYLKYRHYILAVYQAGIERIKGVYYITMDVDDYLSGLDDYLERQHNPDSDIQDQDWTIDYDRYNEGFFGTGGDESNLVDQLVDADLIEQIGKSQYDLESYRDSKYGVYGNGKGIDLDSSELIPVIADQFENLLSGARRLSGPQQDDDTMELPFRRKRAKKKAIMTKESLSEAKAPSKAHYFILYGGKLPPVVLVKSTARNWRKLVVPALNRLYRETTGEAASFLNKLRYPESRWHVDAFPVNIDGTDHDDEGWFNRMVAGKKFDAVEILPDGSYRWVLKKSSDSSKKPVDPESDLP
jgi:hypothetical protein